MRKTITAPATGTRARSGAAWVNGSNYYTATATDSKGRSSTDTIGVILLTNNVFVYDLNGNLRTNGNQVLEYDDENQLTSITVSNAWRSEFAYDGKMRRRVRREFTWQSAIGDWQSTNEVHYIYDGNIVVQERHFAPQLAASVPQQSITYTRGKDLSGTFQGAGGIGGLLARTDNSLFSIGDPLSTTFYHADGNGNVTMLINAAQQIAAKYIYDPFGNTISMIGLLASANLYRFSGKEIHVATGMYYYGYRFYDPSLQKWATRDPRTEAGSVTLRVRNGSFALVRPANADFAFLANDPVDSFDALGLQTNWKIFFPPPNPFPSGGAVNASGNPGTLGTIGKGNFPDYCPSKAPHPCKDADQNTFRNITPIIPPPQNNTDGDVQCFKCEQCDIWSMGVGGQYTFNWNPKTFCVNVNNFNQGYYLYDPPYEIWRLRSPALGQHISGAHISSAH